MSESTYKKLYFRFFLCDTNHCIDISSGNEIHIDKIPSTFNVRNHCLYRLPLSNNIIAYPYDFDSYNHPSLFKQIVPQIHIDAKQNHETNSL
jgi:hypothetical protein